jgi:hypothetical protein
MCVLPARVRTPVVVATRRLAVSIFLLRPTMVDRDASHGDVAAGVILVACVRPYASARALIVLRCWSGHCRPSRAHQSAPIDMLTRTYDRCVCRLADTTVDRVRSSVVHRAISIPSPPTAVCGGPTVLLPSPARGSPHCTFPAASRSTTGRCRRHERGVLGAASKSSVGHSAALLRGHTVRPRDHRHTAALRMHLLTAIRRRRVNTLTRIMHASVGALQSVQSMRSRSCDRLS